MPPLACTGERLHVFPQVPPLACTGERLHVFLRPAERLPAQVGVSLGLS